MVLLGSEQTRGGGRGVNYEVATGACDVRRRALAPAVKERAGAA